MSTTQNANQEKYYLAITFAIIVGLVGVFLRFGGDAPAWSWAANVILVIGVILALRSVFAILK